MDELALAQVLVGSLVRLPERFQDDALDLGRGHARHRAGLVLSALGQDAGDVVAIAGAVLDRVARGHAVAAVVEDAPEQEGVACRVMTLCEAENVALEWAHAGEGRPDTRSPILG